LLAVTHAPAALAWDTDGICGSSPPNWNAPKGAVVANHTDGPIRAIMDSIGESRTHVQLSHGTTGWVTQATTATPSAQEGCQYSPVTPSELGMGYPGFSQTNLGGIYQDLYGGSQPTFVRYTSPNPVPGWLLLGQSLDDPAAAQGTADWLWYSIPYAWSNSLATSATGIYLLGNHTRNPATGAWDIFQRFPYEFFQYKWSGLILDGSTAYGHGVVCSTSLAYGFAAYRAQVNPNYSKPNIAQQYYTKSQVVNAAVALWYAIDDQCLAGLSWEEKAFDWVANCDASATCNRAAWQVLNCFFWGPNLDGSCTNVDGTGFNSFANDPNQTDGARTLSPDGLLGYKVPYNSPWAAYGDSPVQWSGAGSTYGCWM